MNAVGCDLIERGWPGGRERKFQPNLPGPIEVEVEEDHAEAVAAPAGEGLPTATGSAVTDRGYRDKGISTNCLRTLKGYK